MCLNGTACLVLRLSRGYCQHTVSIYAKSFMVAFPGPTPALRDSIPGKT